MGNKLQLKPHEEEWLSARDWDIFNSRLSIPNTHVFQILKSFREMDVRKRGKVNRVEFYLYFKYPFITPMAIRLFKTLSKGGEYISFKDYVVITWVLGSATNDALIQFLFDMYDFDGNQTMDKGEITTLFQECFGKGEWFSILNDCVNALLNKYTSMGKVQLKKKNFTEMVRENEVLMQYLPLFVLQLDLRRKTLGEIEFGDVPQRDNIPLNFSSHVWRKTDGDIARETANKRRNMRQIRLQNAAARNMLRRTKEGLIQIKKEELSSVRFFPRRYRKQKKPRQVHIRSAQRMTPKKKKQFQSKGPRARFGWYSGDSYARPKPTVTKRSVSPSMIMRRSKIRGKFINIEKTKGPNQRFRSMHGSLIMTQNVANAWDENGRLTFSR